MSSAKLIFAAAVIAATFIAAAFNLIGLFVSIGNHAPPDETFDWLFRSAYLCCTFAAFVILARDARP